MTGHADDGRIGAQCTQEHQPEEIGSARPLLKTPTGPIFFPLRFDKGRACVYLCAGSWGTDVSLIDSAHTSSDLPSEIKIVGDRTRWTAVCRDQLPPLGDPFFEG